MAMARRKEKAEAEPHFPVARMKVKTGGAIPELQLQAVVAILNLCMEQRIKGRGIHWFHVFRVDPSAPYASVRREYRKLLFLLHPDRNTLPGADTAFQLVTVAWKSFSSSSSATPLLRFPKQKMAEDEDGLESAKILHAVRPCSELRASGQPSRPGAVHESESVEVMIEEDSELDGVFKTPENTAGFRNKSQNVARLLKPRAAHELEPAEETVEDSEKGKISNASKNATRFCHEVQNVARLSKPRAVCKSELVEAMIEHSGKECKRWQPDTTLDDLAGKVFKASHGAVSLKAGGSVHEAEESDTARVRGDTSAGSAEKTIWNNSEEPIIRKRSRSQEMKKLDMDRFRAGQGRRQAAKKTSNDLEERIIRSVLEDLKSLRTRVGEESQSSASAVGMNASNSSQHKESPTGRVDAEPGKELHKELNKRREAEVEESAKLSGESSSSKLRVSKDMELPESIRWGENTANALSKGSLGGPNKSRFGEESSAAFGKQRQFKDTVKGFLEETVRPGLVIETEDMARLLKAMEGEDIELAKRARQAEKTTHMPSKGSLKSRVGEEFSRVSFRGELGAELTDRRQVASDRELAMPLKMEVFEGLVDTSRLLQTAAGKVMELAARIRQVEKISRLGNMVVTEESNKLENMPNCVAKEEESSKSRKGELKEVQRSLKAPVGVESASTERTVDCRMRRSECKAKSLAAERASKKKGRIFSAADHTYECNGALKIYETSVSEEGSASLLERAKMFILQGCSMIRKNGFNDLQVFKIDEIVDDVAGSDLLQDASFQLRLAVTVAVPQQTTKILPEARGGKKKLENLSHLFHSNSYPLERDNQGGNGNPCRKEELTHFALNPDDLNVPHPSARDNQGEDGHPHGKEEQNATMDDPYVHPTFKKEDMHPHVKREELVMPSDPDVIIVPDPDFYEFDKERQEEGFAAGQIWAIYDDEQGLPRYYAHINKVVSVRPFKVDMSWLFPRLPSKQTLAWMRSGFSYTCGSFKLGKPLKSKHVNMFSHIMRSQKVKCQGICILPRKGDVWALYKGWNSSMKPKVTKLEYDIVEVLSDYREETGVDVVSLHQVKDFKTLYCRSEGESSRTIANTALLSFSHQIPAYRLVGDEVAGLRQGCMELDTAATTF